MNCYIDAKKGIINAKNLSHIAEELGERLQKDPIAEQLLTKEYVERYNKNYGAWSDKTKYENAKYIARKLSNRTISDASITMVDPTEVPIGVKIIRQKTILKFAAIKTYDMYAAFEVAQSVASCVVDSYSFFRHDPDEVKLYGQVIAEDSGRKADAKSEKMNVLQQKMLFAICIIILVKMVCNTVTVEYGWCC